MHDRTDADRFLVIACDGIWDVMSNDDVGALLRLQFDSNGDGSGGGGATSSSVDATRDTAKLLDTSREVRAVRDVESLACLLARGDTYRSHRS